MTAPRFDRRTFRASITINGTRHQAIESAPNIDTPAIHESAKRATIHKLIDHLITTGDIDKIIHVAEATP